MKQIGKEGATLLRFLIVGIINTIVGAGTMFLLYNFVHVSYWYSSITNYVVGGICSFFLNKFFTFQNKERSWSQVIKFIFTVAICYIAAYGIAKPLAEYVLSSYSVSIQENVAMATGTCLYTLLNYLIQKLFVFRHK